MNFGINLCLFNGSKFGGVLEMFLSVSSFGVKNAKNNVFEEEWFLSEIFMKLKCSGYSPAEELNITKEACNSVYRKCFCIF